MATILNEVTCNDKYVNGGIPSCALKIKSLRGIFIGRQGGYIPTANLATVDGALDYLRDLSLDANPLNRFVFIPFSEATDNTKAPESKQTAFGLEEGVQEYPFMAEAKYLNYGIGFTEELRKMNEVQGKACFIVDETFIGGKEGALGLYPIPCNFHANLPKFGNGGGTLTENKLTIGFKNINDLTTMKGIVLPDGYAVEDNFKGVLEVELTAVGGSGIITVTAKEKLSRLNIAETFATAIVQTGAWVVTKVSDGSPVTITGVTVSSGNVVLATAFVGACKVKLAAPLVLEALTTPLGGGSGACFESNQVTATTTA
jgi:hypothetical protein